MLVDFTVLEGQRLALIEISKERNDEVVFYMENGKKYRMNHEQDCCEYVHLEDVENDISNVTGSLVIMAECVTQKDFQADCGMWTFYKLVTDRGIVTFRWYGESNGYYGVEVDFEEIED